MNTRSDDFIEEFILYLRNERRYSEYTITSYRGDLLTYTSFLETEGFGDVDEVSPKVAEFYIASLRDSYTPRSIARKISAVQSFYKYFVNNVKSIETNPFLGLSLPKVEKSLPKFVYEDEVEEFLNNIDTNSDLGKRDKLIFELLYGSGLRVSELCNIKLKDVSIDERRIMIHGKGSKDRIVPMSKNAKEAYMNYLILSRPVFLSRSKNMDNDNLLLNFHGGSLTTRGVRDILNRVLDETESTMRVTPHAFRHSFATHLLNNGMDVRLVHELLGHENLSTTQIYTKLSKESLQREYNKAFPKGDKNDQDNSDREN